MRRVVGSISWLTIAVVSGIVGGLLSIILYTKLFYYEIATVDFVSLLDVSRVIDSNASAEEKEKQIKAYLQKLNEKFQRRNEIIIAKQAILNDRRVKDITEEIRKEIQREIILK